MKQLALLFTVFLSYQSWAQFAPPAGQVGSTAIHKDSSAIVAWATGCQVQLGYVDISQPHLGTPNAGLPSQATGPAGDGLTISLGDSGVAVLTFEHPIRNGNGPDFAVFENAFSNTFLELAFVEVSSDGQNFVRFPAISNSDTNVQIGGFGHVDATLIHNLAGKYRAGYGTPFDLDDLLADSAILDVNQVTHVRIIDAIGCIQDAYASRDSRGIKINDPWSTPFPTGGFDLDAVGVIHSNTSIPVRYIATETLHIYPNPIQQGQRLQLKHQLQDYQLSIYNLQGQLIQQKMTSSNRIPTQDLERGCYILQLEMANERYVQKLIVQ